MSKTMKKVSALLLALLMILSFMPMTQESAYAAAKKPGKVKNLKVKVSGKKMTISWKKAKNAKKYSVSIKDNSTKLTATKSTKKTKLKITGQYNTSYKITVKAVNGKTKGKGVSKKAKIGADPNKVDKKDYDEAIRKAQLGEEGMIFLEKQVADLTKILDSYKAADKECQKALDEATKLVEAYEKLLEEDPYYYDLGDDFNKQVDKLKDAIEKAEEADKEAHKEEEGVTELTNDTWNDEVKNAINSMIKANAGQKNKYVVFDFDNTCSIYDVEEQLAVYQLQTMAFAETLTVDELKDILATGIAQDKDAFPDGLDTQIADSDVIPGEGRTASYNDFITDIATAYQKLLDKGYEPTPEGVEFNKYAEDADWKEFATKMRAMYDFVFNAESADVAYPWVLYWFTGMTHDEVYDLATSSHSYYSEQETSWETWQTEMLGTKVGPISYTWSCGTQVSDNINELMEALDQNGIDVWVCSASATDPIRAAIDVWGLHDYVTGLMAMTNKYDGVFDNEYDYEAGCAWYPTDDGDWVEGDAPTKAQTQGKGKVTAIQNACAPLYGGHGPIAGFMDSTGDFNFCTEFKTLQVVTCFNRASRKPKDGGGLVAEIAVYEADTLGYDYAKAKAAGDTLYVLQGRDETGFRTLCNIPDKDGKNIGRATIRVTEGSEGQPAKMFANADNQTQLDYIINNGMTVEEAFNKFAIKRKKNTEGNPFNFDIGFLKEYDGYHSQA